MAKMPLEFEGNVRYRLYYLNRCKSFVKFDRIKSQNSWKVGKFV